MIKLKGNAHTFFALSQTTISYFDDRFRMTNVHTMWEMPSYEISLN